MPLKLPPLLLLGALLVTVQLSCVRPRTTKNPAASASPTEQDVIDKILKHYEEALGGEAAISNIKSLRMKGTFELPGVTGTIEGWRKDPHKTLTVFEFPGIGKLKKGFDGENRWLQTPDGTYLDNHGPEEIAELERDAEVFSAGKIRSAFESMKLETRARINGRDMYVIQGTPPKGPVEKLFFDMENGLLVRWDMARRLKNHSTVFVKVHLDDYRDVGGVKMPFNVRFAFEAASLRIKVDEVEHNIPIDDAVFRKP